MAKEAVATQFSCKVCKEGFDYPDWDCKRQDGLHTVENKTYYHLGGSHVQNVRDRRMFSPLVILAPGKEQLSNTGDNLLVGRCEVQFNAGGVYETASPKEQYYLDKKAGIVSGPEGLRQWQGIYLTAEQQNNLAKAELEDLNRKIKEANDALALAKRGANG